MGNLKDLLKKANQANGGGEDVDSFVDRLKEERQKRSGVTAEQYWQSRDSYNDYLKSVQTINRVRGRDKLVTDYFDDATSFMKSYADGTKNINWDMAMSKDKKKVFDNEYNSLMEREKNLRSFLQDEGISKEYRDQLAEALDSSHWSIVRAKVHRRNLTNYFSQYKSQDDWFNNAPENYEQRIKKYEDAKSKSNVPDSLSWMGDVLDNIGYGDAALFQGSKDRCDRQDRLRKGGAGPDRLGCSFESAPSLPW